MGSVLIMMAVMTYRCESMGGQTMCGCLIVEIAVKYDRIDIRIAHSARVCDYNKF